MLRDAGIQDIKKHPVKGNALKPLVQQYEGALCKLEKTVKVIEMGKKTEKSNCNLHSSLQYTLSTSISVQDPFLCQRQYHFSVKLRSICGCIVMEYSERVGREERLSVKVRQHSWRGLKDV